MSKKILIIAANPAISSTTGWPVGFWASEVTHPYHVFTNKGYEVDIASPQGGNLEMDAMSDPFDPSKYSDWDELSKQVLNDESFKKLLKNTPAISQVNADDYDAIVVAGGQAPMFNFEGEKDLHQFFANFYESGKVTSALCHGTAILRYAKDSKGNFIAKGKKITGFTNGEEDDADQAAGVKVMPWRIEDELKKLGADFKKADNWNSHVVVDGNLVTGQQNMSGEEVANTIVNLLEK
ncbi:type 1 glutamine amidotransferase domain-containing protein [Fulvivirga lutea]|uniref:Type 1 glutamine amidotransferase domain-containing protein n=1 Tax=Fulvivirga lutea TaxID=2810512 RepID=A0A974WFK0_9BACT|nr:type 1 glutamine amidotransferase domain-containing protein [Fulvivirga lutea]QSE97065.1 type 1 glutamine amidotransferase domain-containing protein [Fulvivirga lutea]